MQWLEGPPRPGWEGFLRPDAYLMIVVISAQDDASGQPGQLTLDLGPRRAPLEESQADPNQVLVSVIGPETAPPATSPDRA